MRDHRHSLKILLFVLLMMFLVISGIHPYDRTTWVLEVFPIFIVLPILFVTYKRFPLTNMLYGLIFLHALILMAGGAYSYARVPLGFELQDILSLNRNPYDKIGHFAQGFIPAIVAREILIRGYFINGRKLLAFLVVCVVLAISATYELLEWLSAILLGQGADEFLGTQGDPWDTQSDMFFALIGALCALIGLSKLHDKQIACIESAHE